MNDKKNGILYNKYVPERKEKTMKEKINIRLGKTATRILLTTLPVMIFIALALTLYVFRLDSDALMKERQTVMLALETISRLAVCISVGTILADYAEKRTSD
jgi:hypothetical protein